MPLETVLSDIAERLRQGNFPNEQAISQGIVLRILQELGWDTWDTKVVWPEYQTGEGRVDFALCNPPSKPAIFAEVKQPGKAEEIASVKQALKYAFDTGVPFVVLTDGRTWNFYLPAEQGSYEDRRVYKLDLYERTAEEAAGALQRYLARSRVESDEALEAARKEYRSRNRRSQAKAAIPEAWWELVEKGDELLVEILSDAAESKAGVRPEVDDVAEFLVNLGRPKVTDYLQGRVYQQETRIASGSSLQHSPPKSSRAGEVILFGKSYPYGSAKDALLLILRKLSERDSTFLDRCAQHPDNQGRKRKYIARAPEELYPDREDLQDMRAQLPGGWLLATNISNQQKHSIIRLAAKVANLTLGNDIHVDF